MKQIVVISGKGGTGKTVLTASFAFLSKSAVLADCDVDAADLHILLEPKIIERHEFRGGKTAVIDNKNARNAINVLRCADLMRFQKIL